MAKKKLKPRKTARATSKGRKPAVKRRIAWKAGRVFSIKLRNGHYALLQMLSTSGRVAVFDCFRKVDEWSGVRLTKRNALFTGVLLDDVLKRSVVAVHKDVAPVEGVKYSEVMISVGDEFRRVKVWEGTKDEREFLMMGEGNNALCRYFRENGEPREEYIPIALNDYDKYKNLELTNLYGYPSFNERLYLCELFGRNVDPLKEIAFNRPLPREYRTYIDIIAGKTRLSELGY